MGNSNNEWGALAAHDDEMAEAWDGFGHLPDPGSNMVLDSFIETKHLTHNALVRLGTRLAEDQVLAFAFDGGIKFRDMLTGRRWTWPGSEFAALKIVQAGREPSSTVIVAEGETDGAWLSDHCGLDVAILPAGANPKPHAQAYAAQLSNYDLVLLAQDADNAGDKGAEVLADQLPRAVRYPPPSSDWCSDNPQEMPSVPDVPAVEMQLLVPAGELLQLEPPPLISWYEHGLLPVAGQMMIHGWAKSYKSFLALDLMACLAQGIPWCGFEPTEEPCRVAVMQYEIPWPYYQQRIAAIMSAATDEELFKNNFLTWTPMRRPTLVAGNTASEDLVLRTLDMNDVQVFLVDPVRRATGTADLNSEKEVRALLHFFERAQDLGITVIACHHDNKTYARQGGGDPLGMTGAGSFAGDADTIISVSLPKGQTLESPQRNLHFTTRNAASQSPRGMAMTEASHLIYSNTPHGYEAEAPETTRTHKEEPAI